VWTREDSIRNGAYRPLTYHRLRGGLDAEGRIAGWHHRVLGAGGRGLVVPGAGSPPYQIPNLLADFHLRQTPVPVGAWRSVSYTHQGFVIESFIDELAHAAGACPYEFRRTHMTVPQLRAALDLVAEKAEWGTPLPEGRGRGIAAVSSFSSHAAEVAEVTVENGQLRVDRVVAAVHCGRVINPDTLRAQVVGGITLALSYTLKHAITIEDGAVVEGNYTDYPILRIDEMPDVEVHVVPSTDPPTGIGEPPVPPLAAAVANAVFAATGRRVRELPIRL
jgi:isoquinoline 1-oxidoreductase beta subunit